MRVCANVYMRNVIPREGVESSRSATPGPSGVLSSVIPREGVER